MKKLSFIEFDKMFRDCIDHDYGNICVWKKNKKVRIYPFTIGTEGDSIGWTLLGVVFVWEASDDKTIKGHSKSLYKQYCKNYSK